MKTHRNFKEAYVRAVVDCANQAAQELAILMKALGIAQVDPMHTPSAPRD